MKQLRNWVPLFGILGLLALFLKMPEAPNFFGIFKCTACGTSDPYLPMFGGAYFATLVAISMLFPTFPNSLIAKGGLIWAIMLALSLTYLNLPNWCVACLIGHLCNIAIWSIWWIAPAKSDNIKVSPFRERLFQTMLTPIISITLFSCLNLTFLVYNLKLKQNFVTTTLQAGENVPAFKSINNKNLTFSNIDISEATKTFINFVSPNCPYCEEQLAILESVADQLAKDNYHFINISPALTSDLVQQSSLEWFEDKHGELRELFKVSGYPTLFVVGPNGKILKVISGVSKELTSAQLIN